MSADLKASILEKWKRFDYAIAFKIGVTAALSYYAGQSLVLLTNRQDVAISGLWCVLTSIVVIKSNLGGTNQAALYRFLGIVIGSGLGGFFAYYLGSTGLTLGIGVFFTVLACLLVNIKDSIRIAALSVAVIMVMNGMYPEHNPWTFSLFRFVDSTVGIIVAMFVSHFLFPKQAEEDIHLNLAKILSSLGKLLQLSLEGGEHAEMHKLASDLIKTEVDKLLIDARNNFEHTKLELFSRDDDKREWSLILDSIDRIYEAILAIRTVFQYNMTKIFDDDLSNQLEKYRDQTAVAFDSLVQQLETHLSSTTSYPFTEEADALAALNDELIRFRSTRSTRRFELEDVENFYVFFYSLRTVGEELQRIETHLTT